MKIILSFVVIGIVIPFEFALAEGPSVDGKVSRTRQEISKSTPLERVGVVSVQQSTVPVRSGPVIKTAADGTLIPTDGGRGSDGSGVKAKELGAPSLPLTSLNTSNPPPNLTLYTGSGSVNEYTFDPSTTRLDVTSSVGNIGGETTGSFRTGWYLSADIVLDLGDQLVATAGVGSLTNGFFINVMGSALLNTISGLPPGSYYVIMLFDDLNEVPESDETDNQWYFTTPLDYTIDTSPPTITVLSAPTTANAGSSITVSATADDPSGISEFFLVYYVGSDINGIRLNFASGRATIPGSAVTANGLDYFIAAIDNAGYNDRTTLFSVAISVSSGALSHTIVGGSEVSAYRLFSVPLDLQNKEFNSFFSGANDLGSQGTDWRFFAYSNRTPIEYGSATSAPLTSGRAYFVISRSPRTISTKAGTTNLFSTLALSGISLSSGWNLVGNPMAYDIRLSNFTLDPPTGDDLTSVAYSWTGPGGWVQGDLRLRSWEGLAVRVSGNTQLKLTNFTGPLSKSGATTSESATGSDPFAKQRNELSKRGAQSEWLVHIVAKDQDMADQINYIGVLPTAKDGYDEFDRYEPPVVPGAVSLYFVKEDWEERSDVYTTDIRSPTNTGHVWLATVVGKPYSNVEVEFSGLDQVPEDFDLFVIAENGMVHNLRSRPTIELNTVEGERTLTLIIGTSDFIRSNSGGINLIPRAFALYQNYPNPFNPSTTIRYELPVQAHVTLRVYSVLGEKLATLVDVDQQAGYYEERWDVSSSPRGVFASGVYFYRLTAESSGSSVFHELRKMVLVK